MIKFFRLPTLLLGLVYAFTCVQLHAQDSGLEVERLLSGPLGGDAQIAALVAEHKVGMVIFFRDPLGKHPHEPDVQMLMRVCDVHNVPIATNPATAELMLRGFLAQHPKA